jgi:hypothetical protein
VPSLLKSLEIVLLFLVFFAKKLPAPNVERAGELSYFLGCLGAFAEVEAGDASGFEADHDGGGGAHEVGVVNTAGGFAGSHVGDFHDGTAFGGGFGVGEAGIGLNGYGFGVAGFCLVEGTIGGVTGLYFGECRHGWSPLVRLSWDEINRSVFSRQIKTFSEIFSSSALIFHLVQEFYSHVEEGFCIPNS